MSVQPEIGKRYLRRDGQVSGAIEVSTSGSKSYPFHDSAFHTTYTAKGTEYLYFESPADLVSEYALGHKDVENTANRDEALSELVAEGQRLGMYDVSSTVDATGIGAPKPEPVVRQFDTGATRNADTNKLDYEGFLSPFALRRYAQYMHAHRVQADGTVRPGSNWKLGITDQSYMQSMWRHFMDVWENYSGITAVSSETGQPVSLEDSLCALLFNVHGMLHEAVKRNGDAK